MSFVRLFTRAGGVSVFTHVDHVAKRQLPPAADPRGKCECTLPSQQRVCNERYATIPDNVDLVILEAAPARRPGVSLSSSHASFLQRASHD